MNRILAVAVAGGALLVCTTVQAESSRPSESTLNAMGLAGVQVMSDLQAMEVRGMGYYAPRPKKGVAVAYGKSYAHVSGHGAKAGSHDGFYAKGHYVAAGKHGSKAKIVITKDHGRRRGGGGNPQPYTNGGGGGHNGGGKHSKSVKVYAGGYAFAYTK